MSGKLTDEEVTAYLHRAEVGNPDAARWASEKLAEHIARLTAEGKELAATVERLRTGHQEWLNTQNRVWNEQNRELAEARRLLGDTLDFLKHLIAGRSQYYFGDKLMANGMVHAKELDAHIRASLPAKPSGGEP